MKRLPHVALVGRMNVGKSTLFNRLSHHVKSVTHNYAGITRDVIHETLDWDHQTFVLVDTGGMAEKQDASSEIAQAVQQRARQALHDADVIVLVVDGKAGVLAEDEALAQRMRTYNVPVIIAVNKGDTRAAQDQQYEFYQLPHDAIVLISAQHGTRIDELKTYMVSYLPFRSQRQHTPEYRVSLLGRPNVGKSSLLNLLTKKDRVIVTDQPGTTREALAESVAFYKQQIQLTDTPGVRRPGSVDRHVEPMMVRQAMRAVRTSDIILLLIDASETGIVHQELKLASYAFEQQYKAVVLLVNKYDTLDREMRQQLEKNFDFYRHMLQKLPIVHISCKTGKNVGKIMPLVDKIWKRHTMEFSDEELEDVFVHETRRRPLVRSEQRIYVQRAQQVATAPLTIALYVNKPYLCEDAHIKFFENVLRKRYTLTGVPIRFVIYKS